MTNKELQRLSRKELLEILLEQNRENDNLKKQLEKNKQELDNRQLMINNAGSIAEASLQINQVFDTAQRAAEQYLENVRALSGRQEQVCKQMEEDAKKMVAETTKQCQALESETAEKCALMMIEAEEAAEDILRKAYGTISRIIDGHACENLLLQCQKESELNEIKYWQRTTNYRTIGNGT